MYTLHWPTHLHHTTSTGPPVSNVHTTSAHPSPSHPIYRPTRLHHTTSTGPSISNVHPLLGPPVTTAIHLHSLSFIIFYIIHIPILIYNIYLQPIHVHRVHTTPSAHPYNMVQLLPWAHIGWPVPIGTLSTLAARLRRVNSLNGLNSPRYMRVLKN